MSTTTAVVPSAASEATANQVAAGVAAAAAAVQEQVDAFDGGPANKWSKNGYGAAVTKQSGKFSKEESGLVRAAIEEYCHAKQISVSRLCSECDHKAELKGAWMEIAKRLPHRSVQSVYRHGIRQCHPFKRGAWSEQECLQLADLVQRMGKKWSSIQAKLNRSADSCRDKFREMSDDYIKGRWKEEETEQLKRLIREHLHVDATVDMKTLGTMVEAQAIQIPWSALSKKMGKRSRLSCFKKWQKMTGLYSPADEHKRKTEGDDDDDDDEDDQGAEVPRAPPPKRMKKEEKTTTTSGGDYDEMYSAKMAAETVEAVELPDTGTLVREI